MANASAPSAAAKKKAVPAKAPVGKPAAKPVTKPVAKAAAKSAPKAVAKPATKPATVKAAAVKTSAVPASTGERTHVSVVRDSFTMTAREEAMLKLCKREAIALGRETKKSEVLRAAIQHFVKLSATERNAAYAALDAIKTGRPKKTKR